MAPEHAHSQRPGAVQCTFTCDRPVGTTTHLRIATQHIENAVALARLSAVTRISDSDSGY